MVLESVDLLHYPAGFKKGGAEEAKAGRIPGHARPQDDYSIAVAEPPHMVVAADAAMIPESSNLLGEPFKEVRDPSSEGAEVRPAKGVRAKRDRFPPSVRRSGIGREASQQTLPDSSHRPCPLRVFGRQIKRFVTQVAAEAIDPLQAVLSQDSSPEESLQGRYPTELAPAIQEVFQEGQGLAEERAQPELVRRPLVHHREHTPLLRILDGEMQA
jgi:hypothetical protein